jgi:hypothetical protein
MQTVLAVVLAAAAAIPHVRPTDAMAQAAFDRGRQQSPTFTRLVDELERSGVIVHVETSLRMRQTLGGQFFFVTEGADGSRYLRIRLNARAGAIDLTARLGHELQHAVEASRAGVRNTAGLVRLYRAVGTELDPGVFDTEAARDIQERVTAELFDGRAVAVASGEEATERGSCSVWWVGVLLR